MEKDVSSNPCFLSRKITNLPITSIYGVIAVKEKMNVKYLSNPRDIPKDHNLKIYLRVKNIFLFFFVNI